MLHARRIKPWYTMVDWPHEDLHNRNVLLSIGGISIRTSRVGSPHSCQTRSKKLRTFPSSSSSKGVENKMSRQIESVPHMHTLHSCARRFCHNERSNASPHSYIVGFSFLLLGVTSIGAERCWSKNVYFGSSSESNNNVLSLSDVRWVLLSISVF